MLWECYRGSINVGVRSRSAGIEHPVMIVDRQNRNSLHCYTICWDTNIDDLFSLLAFPRSHLSAFFFGALPVRCIAFPRRHLRLAGANSL